MRSFLRLGLLGLASSLLACGLIEPSDDNPGDTLNTASEDTGSDGSCSEDEDCEGRGEVCGLVGQCVVDTFDLTKTCDESQSPTFTGVPVPFFRGEVCTVKGRELPPKFAIPVTLRTCHHPCVTPGTEEFQVQWDCEAGTCAAIVLAYSMADADACPPEAWGQFPQEDCVWSEVDTMGVGPIVEADTPIEAALDLEFPFLSNQDLQVIIDYQALDLAGKESQASESCTDACDGFKPDTKSVCLDECLIEGVAFQYPQQEDRVLPFDLRHVHDDPPETCGDGDPRCYCYRVGFG